MSDDKDTGKDTDTISPRARPESTLARRITQARLSLAWEAIWPAVWPALGVAGLFIGIALLDVFSYLPGWLHAASLAAVACFLGFAIYTGVRTLVWPNRRDAVRRIEMASGLDHRPLEALQDKLPDGMTDPTARALWQAHQQQMADRIRTLKVGDPVAGPSCPRPLGPSGCGRPAAVHRCGRRRSRCTRPDGKGTGAEP
jgi:hypothetical protein